MASTHPKPAGCIVEEIDDFDGRTYRWKNPSGGPFRYFIAAFFMFWLCAWAFGWVMAATALIRGKANGGELFLAGWLGAWTIGGMFVFFMLYLLLRPQQPESVTLGFKFFRYDSATAAPTMFFNPWYAMRRYNGQWPFPGMFQRRKRVEMAKGDLGPVVLQSTGDRQRLYFDNGADRVEIGEHLREPEREWLAAVIGAWKEAS